MTRPPPVPPFPGRLRVPQRGFGWLEDALLHEGWVRELGPDAVTILTFLALAADRHGASFFGRMRIVALSGIDLARVDKALDRWIVSLDSSWSRCDLGDAAGKTVLLKQV